MHTPVKCVYLGALPSPVRAPFFWGMTMTNEGQFHELYGPHFSYDEFLCKCLRCTAPTVGEGFDEGEWYLTAEFAAFMGFLITMRTALQFPFIINSGHRCSEYNDQIYVRRGSPPGEHLDGPHTVGAADIKVAFDRAYKLNKAAAELQMGIGLKQTGDIAGRFIHVDNLGARLWTY